MITVILNCYKRVEYLEQQIQSINNQTIKPNDIFIWYNKPEDREQINLMDTNCKVAMCNHNFKFHGRFAYGLLAKTEYVAFFDDDTIPNEKWFENCINTINSGYDGILGTSGVYLKGDNYADNYKVGWNGVRSNEPIEVDLVGHAWFMKRKYLNFLWREEPISWENGEDIQLSYFAQKYGNLKTYVPPHPENDQSLWGSNPITGNKYGMDSNGSSMGSTSHKQKILRNQIVSEQIKRGWKLVRQK